jgi:hypothetical protein
LQVGDCVEAVVIAAEPPLIIPHSSAVTSDPSQSGACTRWHSLRLPLVQGDPQYNSGLQTERTKDLQATGHSAPAFSDCLTNSDE